ncbi:hypothetical protein [Ancylomarina sp.]
MKKALRILFLVMALGTLIAVLSGAYWHLISLAIYLFLQSLCVTPKQVKA